MATSLFANAVALEKPKTAAKKADKLEVNITELQQLAEIAALMQTLDATKKTLEARVKAAGFEKFLELAAKSEIRPESFRGIDGLASASVEMRKRGTNSALNEEEMKILGEAGIEPFKQPVQAALFAINPKYAEDGKLLEKVSAAIAKFVPEDFIVHQPEVAKFVVSDDMLNAAIKQNHREAIEVCTTMALKPKLSDSYPMQELFDNVREIVQPTKPVVKAALPKAKKTA